MEYGEPGDEGAHIPEESSSAAVNPIVLDYYKKFGRQRDLEQFFSLSTAESEVKDVTSLFWRRMKSQDSSDSGDKKSESSTELCRISIKCSIPEPSSSQEDTSKTKSDSVSPPIITEYTESKHSDEESVNDENQSQKSMDATLDTSTNKPLSPTSSITSQRKLEWDSLADVGYANESDRKTSGSSLSTLERLALKQQYANNDSKENIDMGPPTAHSTMVDNDDKPRNSKKGPSRKPTKIYQKDVDIVEVNIPHRSEISPSQAINVNLTKHISFNMDKDGQVTVEKYEKNVTPENQTQNLESVSFVKMDKEIQTSLTKTKEKSVSPVLSLSEQVDQKSPVLISLNTLRKKYKRKKLKVLRKKLKSKKKLLENKENIPVQEKSAEQVSAAESFEYMPGHVYNQNQINLEQPREQSRSVNNTDNKSSLESSGAITTDSSKASNSFTKDLEKSIDLLKTAFHKKRNDSELKSKLIKEVVQRLLKTKYPDDESSTDFLSGLSFSSKKLGLGKGNLTTSTSDNTTDNGDNNQTKPKLLRPKKSILRLDKFNSNALASTSQSAPNLPTVANIENPIIPKPLKPLTTNSESDISSGGKHSSDTAFAKTSSEELYHKYLEALHREEAYKKHLKDKEMFLKQKLVCSDTAFKQSQPSAEVKVNNRLKDLIKDLTRNNYDDGSGDASKLEGGSNSNIGSQNCNAIKKHRSHSVFTLSSHNSDDNRKPNLKKRLQNDIKGTSPNRDNCSCQHQFVASKVGVVDSSVQVNIHSLSHEHSHERNKQPPRVVPCDSKCSSRDSPKNIAHILSDDVTGDIKYVCLCSEKVKSPQEMSDNMLIFKCSRLTNRGIQLEDTISKTSNSVAVQCMNDCVSHPRSDGQCQPSTSKSTIEDAGVKVIKSSSSCNVSEIMKTTKCSQTKIAPALFNQTSYAGSSTSSSLSQNKIVSNTPKFPKKNIDAIFNKNPLTEITRCIQTEISINPRISDPSLNDIHIINYDDNISIISNVVPESVNNVDNLKCDYSSKPDSITKRANVQYNNNNDTAIRNSNKISLSCKLDKEIQSDTELNNDVITQAPFAPGCSADNFRIPIQGTNMTLMVKIASKVQESTNVTNEKVATHCIGTDKTDVIEKATCLREECSKGVQSQNTDIFEMMSRDDGGHCSNLQPYTIENTTKITQEDKYSKFQKYSLANSCNAGDAFLNTYPKVVHNSHKPLIRSNTDTGRFMSGQCCQTVTVEKTDAVTQQHPCKDSQSENAREEDSDSCAKSKISSGKSSKSGCREASKGSSSEAQSRKSSCDCVRDPILDIIKDITRRYSKKDFEATKKKKCFKEIMTVLNYLLDTEEVIDQEQIKCSGSSSAPDTDCDCSKQIQEKQTSLNITKKDVSYCICGKKSPPKGHRCISQAKEKPGCSNCGKRTRETDSSCSETRKVCFDCRTKGKKVQARNPSPCSSKKASTVGSSSSQKDEERVISTCSESSKIKSSDGGQIQEKSARTYCESKTTKSTNEKCVMVDKSVQCSCKKTKANISTESSEIQATDFPSTSTESTTCKVLSKIKRECEKYHQKRCKAYANKRCEISSSTSVNCEQCKRVHHCLCRGHRCHRTKSSAEKIKKKCLAYNLIIQTSDSMISEECADKKVCKQLQNVVVKVPSKCKKMEKEPFKEVYTKIEHHMPPCNPRGDFRNQRSRSCPNESEVSSDGYVRKRSGGYTVRDYLETNCPDFVEKSTNRQQCLKVISEKRDEDPCSPSHRKMVVVHTPGCMRSADTCNMYCGGSQMICNPKHFDVEPYIQCLHNEVTRLANERDVQRQLLSVQLDRRPSLTSLSESELRRLARDLGVDIKRKTVAPKFISEREMKKHSKKIYKSLPEVVQKKEDSKKENLKKTNLLMASIFRKNLQKKTLRGAVNLSNYSTVIKM